jgi:hypothetical protein
MSFFMSMDLRKPSLHRLRLSLPLSGEQAGATRKSCIGFKGQVQIHEGDDRMALGKEGDRRKS